MRPRDLQDFQEDGVRHLAQEMHAGKVKLAPHFVEQALAVGLAVGQKRPVAHLITADNRHPRNTRRQGTQVESA